MLWKEEEVSWIRVIQMYNLRGLLGIRRMDRVPNARIRGLCRMMKGEDESMMRVFSGGLAMWRGWRRIGLLRESM